MTALLIPDAVQRRAQAAGRAGILWLAELPSLVDELAHQWNLLIGQVLPGGTEALVVEVTQADGRRAVLKIRPPDSTLLAGEFALLCLADGHGYANVYAIDDVRSAILIERLGPPLATLGLPIDTQIASICMTLAEAWRPPPPRASFMTGDQKAQRLEDFITTTWQELEQPCSAKVVATARQYAEARYQAFDPQTAVLAHGDAHAWNTLAVQDEPIGRYKLIDPDGLIIERAYDLAICMREWTDDLLVGDPLVRGQQRCHLLATLSGVSSEAIWQWGFLECVSTGLLCLKLGINGGPALLSVAQHWATR